MAHDPADAELDARWLAELERRVDEIRRGDTAGATLDEVEARIVAWLGLLKDPDEGRRDSR